MFEYFNDTNLFVGGAVCLLLGWREPKKFGNR